MLPNANREIAMRQLQKLRIDVVYFNVSLKYSCVVGTSGIRDYFRLKCK